MDNRLQPAHRSRGNFARCAFLALVALMLAIPHGTARAAQINYAAHPLGTVSISPTSGPAGTDVVINSGGHWPKGTSVVVALIAPGHRTHPYIFGRVTVSSSGTWSMSGTIPNSYNVALEGDSGGPPSVTYAVTPGTYSVRAAVVGMRPGFDVRAVRPAAFTVTRAGGSTAIPAVAGGARPGSGAAAGGSQAVMSQPDATSADTMTFFSSGVLLLLMSLALALLVGAVHGRLRRAPAARVRRRLRLALLMFLAPALCMLPGAANLRTVDTAHARSAQATTLFSDDFEADSLGSVPAGWTVNSGTWVTANDGTQVAGQTSTNTSVVEEMSVGSAAWTDYTLQVQAKTSSATSPIAISGRRQNATNQYQFVLKNSNLWYLGRIVSGTFFTLASGGFTYKANTWYTLGLTMVGTAISASINGAVLANVTDSTFSSGGVAMRTLGPAEFDNVLITTASPITATPTVTPTAATSTPTNTPIVATSTATNTPAAATSTPTNTPTVATSTATNTATATNTPVAPGSVVGTITDAGTGAGIANATVTTNPGGLIGATDSQGNYSLANVAPGTYTITASAPGYGMSSQAGVVVSSGAATTVSIALLAPTPTPTGSLFSDNFESDSLSSQPAGWTAPTGTWVVAQDGTQVASQTNTNSSVAAELLVGDNTWTDYSVTSDAKTPSQTLMFGLAGRRQDASDMYQFLLKNRNEWYLGKKVGGTFTTLKQGTFAYSPGTWYTLSLSMVGSNISGSINGAVVGSATDSTYSAGGATVRSAGPAEFDNVFVSQPPPATATLTTTATGTSTATATPSSTGTSSSTPPPGSTLTFTPVATNTFTPTPSATPSATASVAPSNTPQAGQGTISGTIADAGTGAGIGGAHVSTDTGNYTATTDTLGNFTMSSVAAGTYNVVASATGYNSSFQANASVSGSGTASVSIALGAVPLGTTMDTYARPDQPGWGTSSDGNVWNADFNAYPLGSESIVGRTGFVDTFTAATDLDNWMGAPYTDELVSADFTVTQVGQDAFLHGPRLLARMTGTFTYIDFAINVTTNTLALWTAKNNAWNQISGLVSVPAFSLNTLYHAKLSVVGNQVSAKVWPASQAEPNWQVTATQTSLKGPGLGAVRSTFSDLTWQNFTSTTLTFISGIVTDTSGSPIGGASVVTNTGISTTTNAQGGYELPVGGGSYTVTATAPGHSPGSQPVTVAAGSGANANFTLN